MAIHRLLAVVRKVEAGSWLYFATSVVRNRLRIPFGPDKGADREETNSQKLLRRANGKR